MALINGIYVFVETEEVSSNIEVSTHPVEQGIDITDHVKKAPTNLSINGKILGHNAGTIRRELQALHTQGKLVKYIGKRVMNQAQIINFTVSYSSQIKQGCEFTMELKEVRIAKSPYKTKNKKTAKKTKAGTKQVQENKKGKIYHTVKKGENCYTIAKQYQAHGCTASFIMKNNQDAPKIKNDWKTLQIGTKLWVYSK